jgi:hypothetical protein
MFPWREEAMAEDNHVHPRSAASEPVPNKAASRGPIASATNAQDATIITHRQAKRFRAIANEFGWSQDEVQKLLDSQGYSTAESIRRSDYERLCSTLEDSEARSRFGNATYSRGHAKAA